MQYSSLYFKILSLLLQYPDGAYLQALPQLAAAAGRLAPGPERAGIEAFLADITAHDAIQLQERHTAAFDLNPATTMNLSYHRWGDGEKRAAAMTRLKRSYRDTGYECAAAELPDFLPLMLEFMASVPEAMLSEIIRQCLEELEPMLERLGPIAPSYVELLRPLATRYRRQAAAERRFRPGEQRAS
jgi:nitrate reductase delta subunit